jgi:hypothetical protein
MKRRQGFPNSFTNLFDYVVDSRNSESEGICQGCISISNARKMESNLQFQSKQLDWESADPEKDSCTSIDDDFSAECFSTDNSVHTPAPSETSWLSAQQRTRPRSGKHPLEEAVIEIERKKLDLMQSMGNGREDWDTTYHFLMSLWEPINRLPEDRQMFLRIKIQEIFQEI